MKRFALLIVLLVLSCTPQEDKEKKKGGIFPGGLRDAQGAELPQANSNGQTCATDECKPILTTGDSCASGYTCYTVTACDETIATGSAWASIDWSTDDNTDGIFVLCLADGDHTAKGELNLAATGVTESLGKLFVVPTDFVSGTTTHPYNVSAANKPVVDGVDLNGRDDWIISHFETEYLWIDGGEDNTIVDYMDIDGNDSEQDLLVYRNTTSGTVIQWSTVHNSGKTSGQDNTCVVCQGSSMNPATIVHNEIFDCGGDGIVLDEFCGPDGSDIKYNDIYQTSDYWIGCDGNPGSDCSCGEDGIDLKDANGTSTVTILGNRFWGWKDNETTCSSSGGNGFCVNTGGSQARDDVLVSNNICGTGQMGIPLNESNQTNFSVIGNIFYDFNYTGEDGYTMPVVSYTADYHEYYLNTFAHSAKGIWSNEFQTDSDYRCNIWINIDNFDQANWTPSASQEWDYNIWIDIDETLNTEGTNHDTDFSGAGSPGYEGTYSTGTSYDVGDLVVTGGTCDTGAGGATDTDCFIYQALDSGIPGTAPTWPTTCGGEADSGNSKTFKAVWCPFQYKRKLITGEETYTIAAIRPDTSFATYIDYMCPTDGETNETGGRTGIGVNDDVVPNGIFATDVEGRNN